MIINRIDGFFLNLQIMKLAMTQNVMENFKTEQFYIAMDYLFRIV